MKSTEMLNQIKTLLNIEVKLEEMKLENGTIVSAESFEKDKEIFIVTDDEKVAMPVGEYLLEDGRLVVVSEEGMIADVREVSDEAPAKESKEGEEITSDLKEDDNYEEKVKEEDEEMADEGNYVTKDSFKEMEAKIQNLEDAIADLKGDKESKMEEVEEIEEEMSIEKPLKSRTVKEEFSEASSKPIKHNPEGESGKRKRVEFGKGKFVSTLDRVLNKLNK
tara:strand:+ start:333 stop:995 length:663 start_codon:yes stop_codon:yes gene_type:complete